MVKVTAVWLVAVLLSAPLNSAQGDIEYVLNGGKLDLTPSFVGQVKNILWKHGTDLVVEWVQGEDVIYYGGLKERAMLNMNTGRLEIRGMTQRDAGLYTVEINSKVQERVYNVTLIKAVPQPTVWVSPVSCTAARGNCTLTCEGDVQESGPVTYSWREDDGPWKLSAKDLNITSKVSHVPTFSCRIENPVSTKDSEPKINPLFVEMKSEDSDVGKIVGGVIASCFTLLLLGLGIWKRKQIKHFVSQHFGGNSNDGQPGGQPGSPNTRAGEAVPFTDRDPNGMENAPM